MIAHFMNLILQAHKNAQSAKPPTERLVCSVDRYPAISVRDWSDPALNYLLKIFSSGNSRHFMQSGKSRRNDGVLILFFSFQNSSLGGMT